MSYGKVNKTTGERIPYAGNSSGGTSDYTDLTNKPSINNVTLSGNKTASDLSLASTTDLAGKQDKYETITYAQWQALTPAQQAAKDYYISDYPSSAITAGNISYNNSSSGMVANNVQSAVDELKNDLTNLGSATDLGNVQGSDTITLSDSVTNYRFVQILIGYYASGYPCFGHALLPVSTIAITAEDIPTTVAFTDINAITHGRADISFLSATSVKVVNTNEAVYTRIVGIA